MDKWTELLYQYRDKNLIRFGMSLVRFRSTKCSSVQILLLFTIITRVIGEYLIYSKYYSDSGWHDFDVTHNNNK